MNYSFIPKRFTDEEFRLIPELEDGIKPQYIISTYGDIYNINTQKKLVPSFNYAGYLQVGLMTKDGRRVHRKVHRLLMMTFFYFQGCEDYQVNHKNGDKTKNVYWNLEWTTAKENVDHAIDTGLRGSFEGENNPMAVITYEQARAIGTAIINGIPDIEIANIICNGNMNIVRDIAYGRTWNNVFSNEEKEAIKLTRKGNIISLKERHAICKFFEDNKDFYNGYGSIKAMIRDSISSINKDPYDEKIYRIANRLYYKYESPEITCLYKY